MNTVKAITILAALAAFAAPTGMAHAGKKKPVTIDMETEGTIKVGDYETVCDKKPEQCGSEYDPLGPRPKPKPDPKPANLTGSGGFGQLQSGYTPISARR